MKNQTQTKRYLIPNGISYSIIPLDSPTLREWLAAYNTNPRLIDEDYEDATDAEAQRNDEINSLEKFS